MESFIDVVIMNGHLCKRYYTYTTIPTEYHKNLLIDSIVIDEGCVMVSCDSLCTVFEDLRTGTNKMFYVYNDLAVEKIVYEEIKEVEEAKEYMHKLEMKYIDCNHYNYLS
jgi:hypothetical protein